ncbi:MAG: hypothetical protein Q7J57_13440 [Gemmobacter sp.]|nr:hypothetical protein [Gemmobacter sp.]
MDQKADFPTHVLVAVQSGLTLVPGWPISPAAWAQVARLGGAFGPRLAAIVVPWGALIGARVSR